MASPARPERPAESEPLIVPSQGDRILDVEEVATLLKMQPRTVAEWARQGKLPAFKIGKPWLFFEAKLMAHLSDEADRQAWR